MVRKSSDHKVIEDQHEENKNPSFLVVVVGTGQVYPTLSNKPEKSGVIFFFMIAKLTLLVKLSSRFLLGVPNWLTKWKQGWNSCTSPDSAYSKTKHIFWSILFVHKYIYMFTLPATQTQMKTPTPMQMASFPFLQLFRLNVCQQVVRAYVVYVYLLSLKTQVCPDLVLDPQFPQLLAPECVNSQGSQTQFSCCFLYICTMDHPQ